MNEIQQLLLSDMPLWISPGGYIQLMISAFPVMRSVGLPMRNVADDDVTLAGLQSALLPDAKTYQERTHSHLESISNLMKQEDSTKQVTLTDDFDSEELPEGSIAYHRIFGLITAGSRWYFSSKQLEKDLQEAEGNPSITAHLMHVNSPGGEAWYLDRLAETLQNCRKPILAIYENCTSAAYHIACHAQRIYANTKFDFVGCIGTMTSFYDFEEYYKQLGIKKVEAKATQSDLKNKMLDDLCDGKPKQYIERVLNPLNDNFIATVKSQRKQLAQLGNDTPVLRGETYYTEDAIQIGLCDGQRTLIEAIAECAAMGKKYYDTFQKKNSLYNAIL